MARILAIDDERPILQLVVRALSRDGHALDATDDPTSVPGRDLTRYDLILTDIMMPGLDGFELVRRIRDQVDAPIVFLTAKVAEEDAVAGLGLGADDYLRKPFGVAELRAKVSAHLRREHRERRHVLVRGSVRFDLDAREVAITGVDDAEVSVALTPTEYGICEFLARHPGQVYSRLQIREAAFGWESSADDAAISVHVGNARAKLRRAGADPIATVWGVGYKWEVGQ